MALTGQNIIERAAMIIQDITNVRWPLTELTDWLNDGRREIAINRPDVYTAYETVTLTNDVKQVLSTLTIASGSGKGLKLRDVPRNTTGRAISLTQRGFLDQQNPTWQTSVPPATNGEIKHFMVDERSPDVFWVYPKPSGGNCQVDIIYQYTPKDYIASGQAQTGQQLLTAELAPYETLYGGALVDYLCYRAFSKDSEYAGNAQRALAHYQQFQNALGIGHKNDLTYSANLANVGGVPSKQLATGG